MKKWMGLFALLAALPMAANARVELQNLVGAQVKPCAPKEQVTINVSFNQKADGFASAKTMFDEKIKKIEEYARQQKVKLTLQNQNFNISSNRNYDGEDNLNYQMSGNLSYMLEDANAGLKFAEFLSQQKWQVNLSSNSYRRSGVNCMGEDIGE